MAKEAPTWGRKEPEGPPRGGRKDEFSLVSHATLPVHFVLR